MRNQTEQLTRHIDALFRAAWAMTGSRYEAEDLVQETYSRVFAKPRKIRRGAELGYLMTAMRHTLYSEGRRRSHRPETPLPDEDLERLGGRSADDPVRMIEAQEIYAAIADLPDDFRLAITAVDVLGLSYADAASALGTVEATLSTRVHRARKRVASALYADVPEPSPAGPGTGNISRPGASSTTGARQR